LDRDVIETRDPGGTAIGNQVRGLLLDGENARMASLTELFLYEASRAQLVEEVIRPSLAAGRIVLCDRFTDATFAYQGGGRGFDVGVLSQLEAWVQQGRQPDLTLWFELAPALAAERRAAARAPDRFERQDETFFARTTDKSYRDPKAFDAPEKLHP